MAVIVKLKSGNWRVQVRRKGKYASRTFLRKCDAEGWAVQTQRDIDQGKRPSQRLRTKAPTFGDLIDLHIQDLVDVGKRMRRSKEHVLRRLKEDLGDTPLHELTKADLIAFWPSARQARRRPRNAGDRLLFHRHRADACSRRA